MWKKIVISLVILLIFLSTYGLYIFLKNNNTTDTVELTNKPILNNKDNIQSEKENNESPRETRAFHMNKSDCKNECSNFKNDLRGLHYCQNFCGLLPVRERDIEEHCKDLNKGLPRDYCFRDKAISAKDMNICSSISDRGVKEHCENRITEDIIDELF